MDKAVRTFCADADKVNIDKRLALRFLRVRREPDEQTTQMFNDCVDEFKSAVSYKASYRLFDIEIKDNNIYFGDELMLSSETLCKNLAGCEKAFVFVATTSANVDRLIHKYTQLQLSRAVVIDAIGSAAVEGFCDLLCEKLESEHSVSFRPRFSPGYGDLSIMCQPKVLGVCDASRKIGVTLNSNNLMIPMKTVSAIVGIRPQGEQCDHSKSCENCENTNCQYRE